MNPQYPIYIPSKGRADSRFTVRVFDHIGVPYRVIVEEQEFDEYAKVIDPKKLLILDPQYQRDYDPYCRLKPQDPRGSGPARNFAWEHSIKEGHAWHWIIDDNIESFFRMNRNMRIPVSDGSMFAAMESFASRYKNVAMAGPDYMWVATGRKVAHEPFTLNTRIYSCILIRNDTGCRWRGRFNEDTDLSLRVLKAGWCTIMFKAFLQRKLPTMTVRGGNTDSIYVDGTLAKSRMIVNMHPDVARLAWKFRRWHHYVNYNRFKNQRLILRDDIKIKGGVDNFGMELLKTDVSPYAGLRDRKKKTAAERAPGAAEPEIKGMKYGNALPESFEVPSSMFWIKKDLEKNPFDMVVLSRNDKVMDCGSCIGTFAAAALEQGASCVRCYEPMPKNIALLRKNLKRYGKRAAIVEAALVANGNASVEMSLSGFSGAHSILPKDKAKKATVPAKCFRKELLAFKPRVIKIDVEGAEYQLLESLKPGDLRGVSSLFIEFHPYDDRDKHIAAIKDFVVAEGLSVVKERRRAFTAIRK